MAIAKFGMFITALKGKIGGTVTQGGKAGNVVKNKPNWKPPKYINRPLIPGSSDPDFMS